MQNLQVRTLVGLLFFLIGSRGAASYVTGGYFGYEQRLDLCHTLPFWFSDELRQFEDLNRELRTLLNQADALSRAGEISSLTARLKIHGDRITAMARPEWNSEKFDVVLGWLIPESVFFNFPARISPWGPLSRGDITSIEVKDVEFLGQLRPELKAYVSSSVLLRSGVEIQFRKRATLFELCQFVHSIDISVNIESRDESFEGISFEPQTKPFNLIYEEFNFKKWPEL